mgnify:CR=1 FL=1
MMLKFHRTIGLPTKLKLTTLSVRENKVWSNPAMRYQSQFGFLLLKKVFL